jgi:hypothetical protein
MSDAHHRGSAARRRHAALASVLILSAATGVSGVFQSCSGGSGGGGSESSALAVLRDWNAIAMEANAVDHAAPTPEQPGPCRTARAFAIVHVAMLEALIAADGGLQSYVGIPAGPGTLSRSASVAQAAHDALVALYPAQIATFGDALALGLGAIPDGAAKSNGITVGQTAAAAILALRAADGSALPEPLVNVDFIPNQNPGFWRQDPVFRHPLALGAFWDQVLPFAITSANQFPVPAPPGTTDTAYTIAYDEVKAIGGDGIATATARTPEQTLTGIFWGYDGTPGLGTPPRLFNQIVVHIGTQQGLGDVDLARLLALVNVSMADAGLACWRSKYAFQLWRPNLAVRESDPGTGPTMLGDGNSNTLGDPGFTPLGAQASNQAGGVNFTPPFPAYPSGHAALGGAAFQVMRRFFGTDQIAFTFVSEELDGVTTDASGNPRPLVPRSFLSLSQAEDENGQARIYLGVQWPFGKTEGLALGNAVGDWVFDHLYQPVP